MFKLVVLTLLSLSAAFCQDIPYEDINAANVACTIDIHTQTASPQPVYLKPGTADVFYPANREGQIQMAAGEQMEMWCSSPWTNFPNAPNLITASCVSGQTFSYAGTNFNFNQFRCDSWPQWQTNRTTTPCFNGAILVDVGFLVEGRWVHVYTSCHDVNGIEHNWYTIHHFTPISDASQRSVSRPRFTQSDFFPGRNVDSLQTRANQRITIGNILGSTSQAEKFIEADPSDVFLSRGHVAAMTDFIYGFEQQATFIFINACPQWQTFNGRNWVSVEISSRQLASDRNIHLDVWTGTHGITRLWTESGEWRQIFLDWPAGKIPVPMIYYKLIVHQATNSGVVLVGVNNYHLTLEDIFRDGYVVCHDVSDQIGWVSWTRTDLSRGYSYACEVQDFLRAVPHIQGLGHITNLLI